jgi:hypothetical protein
MKLNADSCGFFNENLHLFLSLSFLQSLLLAEESRSADSTDNRQI